MIHRHSTASTTTSACSVVFEDNKPDTLAEALATLENGLADWFKDQGIE